MFGTISSVIRYGPNVGAANVPPRLCNLVSEIFTSTKSPTRSVWNFCEDRSRIFVVLSCWLERSVRLSSCMRVYPQILVVCNVWFELLE